MIMLYQYSRITIRQDVDTPFWNFTPEQLANIKTKYDDSGRRVQFSISISEDGLIETRSHVWASRDDWVEYNQEYSDSWVTRDNYNTTNNIYSVRSEG